MHMIKPLLAVAAVIWAAGPAVACDLELNGGPHRFFAFASQLAATQGGDAEPASVDRVPAKAEQGGSTGSDESADASPPGSEAVQLGGKQDPSDAATLR